MYDNLKCKTLFNLDETIAKDIFNDVTFPWLSKIIDLRTTQKTLSLEEYSHPRGRYLDCQSANRRSQCIDQYPCIIGKTEVRPVLLSVAMRMWRISVVGNSTELKMPYSFNNAGTHYNYVGDSILDISPIWGADRSHPTLNRG